MSATQKILLSICGQREKGSEGGRQDWGPSSANALDPSTCIVEGDRLFISANLISSLAAVTPRILWGHPLNDQGSLGIHADSGVVPRNVFNKKGPVRLGRVGLPQSLLKQIN